MHSAVDKSILLRMIQLIPINIAKSQGPDCVPMNNAEFIIAAASIALCVVVVKFRLGIFMILEWIFLSILLGSPMITIEYLD